MIWGFVQTRGILHFLCFFYAEVIWGCHCCGMGFARDPLLLLLFPCSAMGGLIGLFPFWRISESQWLVMQMGNQAGCIGV